jgi:hypothetical protein
MLKAVGAKIKSALSKRPPKKAILITLAVLCLALPFVFSTPISAVLRVYGASYKLQIVSTETARQTGLGGRATLAEDAGMLFVLDEPRKECFWMKDMRFSLDIIWLDAQKQVVHMEQNVASGTYPTTFCSSKPAAYVIELRAGEVAKRHIVLKQKLDF